MTQETDYYYFKLRKEGLTYFSKVFPSGAAEKARFVYTVMNDTDSVVVGEIEGALCLRVDGNSRKTQVVALVSQDNKRVRRLTLQTFKSRNNKALGEHIESVEKNEFSFRPGEFEKLLKFLKEIEFVDLSNEERFQIEDISSESGRKAIIDASDKAIVHSLRSMNPSERETLLASLRGSLTANEVNILLGRKSGLEEFAQQMHLRTWDEAAWQNFFDREQWVFGYGLDYRIMKQFAREATVGLGGSDNKNRPVVDFLMSFTDFTVLVEIKLPSTAIFKSTNSGRAGTWEFTSAFISAVSQVLEQQAEWQVAGPVGDHFNGDGTERLRSRTRKPKTILVIGSKDEFLKTGSERDRLAMLDTFELFRRECGSIDIITFDELYERATFIANKDAR